MRLVFSEFKFQSDEKRRKMKIFVNMMTILLLIGICITGCSKDSDQTVAELNAEALRLAQTGQHDQAIEKAAAALKKSEKESGADHPDTIMSLEIMGLVYQSMGAPAEAESAFLRALSNVKKKYGPNSSGAAKIMNNLAGVYYAQQQYILASSFFKQSLNIVEKQFSADDPRLAVLRKNIDICEAKQNGVLPQPSEGLTAEGEIANDASQTEPPVNLVEDLVPKKIKDSMLSQLSRQNIFISDIEPRQPVVIESKGIVFPYHALKKGKDSDIAQEIVILFAAISNSDKPGAVVFQHCRLISHTSYLAALEKGGMPQLAKEIKEVFPNLYL